jgi:CRP-like cAMP-binding protein
MADTYDLLRILIQLSARQAFPEATIRQVIGSSARQVHADNLWDGNLTQAQIAKKAGLNQGNLSRTVARRIQSGVLFRLGTGRDAKLLHLYPLPKKALPKRKTR